MTPLLLGCVAVGGALGAVSRYELDGRLASGEPRPFPLATFFVNVSGGFLLGLLTGMSHLGAQAGAFLATGFCGAFTTFSTWIIDALLLAERGAVTRAALVVVAGLVGGLALARLGVAVGSMLG